MKKELGLSVLLLLLCAAVALLNPKFLSPLNLANNANVIGLYGIFSIGLGLIIIAGGIDLSVGSMFALIGIFLAMSLRDWHWPWPVALASAVSIPILLGFGPGLLITRLRMKPLIVTLWGLLIYRGLARFIANDNTKGFGQAEGFEILRDLSRGRVLGLPMPFVLLLMVGVIMWFVLHRSVYGRHVFAVGSNEEAARFSGINTNAVIHSTYVVGSLFTGIAAVLLAFYTNSISPSNHGNFYELY